MADTYEDTSAGYDGMNIPNRTAYARYGLQTNYHLEGRGYERRDRSASPRGDRDDRDDRPRDRSPNGRGPYVVISLSSARPTADHVPGLPLQPILV